jgi:hypothetical protein
MIEPVADSRVTALRALSLRVRELQFLTEEFE